MAANYDVLLIKAAKIGDIKQVQALLAAGADVNASTASRTTVLMLATIGGYSEIVRLLIEPLTNNCFAIFSNIFIDVVSSAYLP